MRINITAVIKQWKPWFNTRVFNLGGEECTLIYPSDTFDRKIWTPESMYFRSSLWNSKGELISASFKKFFNLSEPDEYGEPNERYLKRPNSVECYEKVDGTCLVVSYYKEQLIARTRGSIDFFRYDKTGELAKVFKPILEKLKSYGPFLRGQVSFLFEAYEPGIHIVNHGPTPQLTLLNVVVHETYTYYPQYLVDTLAKAYELRRPASFSIGENQPYLTLQELLSAVPGFINHEGLCLYAHDGQVPLKAKTIWWLERNNAANAKISFSDIERVLKKTDWQLDQVLQHFNTLTDDAEALEFMRHKLLRYYHRRLAVLRRMSELVEQEKESFKLTSGAFAAYIKPKFNKLDVALLFAWHKNKFNRLTIHNLCTS